MKERSEGWHCYGCYSGLRVPHLGGTAGPVTKKGFGNSKEGTPKHGGSRASVRGPATVF